MCILRQERPQDVNYKRGDDIFSAEDLPICINCKHSEQNISYPKDEFDCKKTGVFVTPYVLAISLRRIVKWQKGLNTTNS